MILKFNKFINESIDYSNKTLIIVDVQPEYEKFFSFSLGDLIEFINQNVNNFKDIVILYNGYDTLGMIQEGDYKMWFLENGLEEEVLDQCSFFDKGYAFFRVCMDEGIDEDQIINLLNFMMENRINDSRDLDPEMWDKFIEEYSSENIRDLLEFAGDMIHIPDLMDELQLYRYDKILLCGGGITECLKEVEIALKCLEINYETLNDYCY